MIVLSKNQFLKFYIKEVLPLLLPIEKERKILVNTIYFLTVLVFIISIGCYIGLSLKIFQHEFQLGLLWPIFFFIFFAIHVFFVNIIINYKKNLKCSAYPTVFKKIGLEYNIGDKADAKTIDSIWRTMALFDVHDASIVVDDVISGNYKNFPFIFADVRIPIKNNNFSSVSDGGKRGSELGDYFFTYLFPCLYLLYLKLTNKQSKMINVIFQGIVFKIKLNKNYSHKTLIKTDAKFNSNKFSNMPQVKLEDPEFEKYFEVYSEDQIGARYVLTTAFMERLLNYRKKENVNIQVAFEDKYAYFLIDSENKFEPPLFSSILKNDYFYQMMTDVLNVLKIVDTLKLEQNIGM